MNPQKRGELASDIVENIRAVTGAIRPHEEHVEAVLEAIERLGFEVYRIDHAYRSNTE